MLSILALIYLKICLITEVVTVKYAAKIFYIYLAIIVIVINTFVNIIFLVELDAAITSLISSTTSNGLELGDNNIILKIDRGKDNLDLVQAQLRSRRQILLKVIKK